MRTYHGREEEWEPRLFSTEVTIGAFLLFLAAGLLMMWWMGTRRIDYTPLELNGVKAAGVVQAVKVVGAGYQVDYAFNIGGTLYKRSEMSSLSFKKGDPVRVTYLRSDPQRFSTIDAADGTPAPAGPAFLLAAIPCVVIAVVLFTIASKRALNKPKIQVPDWYE